MSIAGDLSDASFSPSSVRISVRHEDQLLILGQLLVASSTALYLFDIPEASPKGKGKEVVSSLNLAKTIDRPTLPGQGESQSTFRAARYVRHFVLQLGY